MELRAKLTLRNQAMLIARNALGLSQAHVADIADCPMYYVGLLEKLDYSFSNAQQIAQRVADALQLDIHQVAPEGSFGKTFPTTQERIIDCDPNALLQISQTLTERNQLPTPEAEAILNEQVASLHDALLKLSYREREIIKLRYGLGSDNDDTCTLEEVGRMFRVTRERVRMIEATAIRKLQAMGLDEFAQKEGK